MKESQKIIKYLAIALAIFLIVLIISFITAGLYGIYKVFDFKIEPRISTYEKTSCGDIKNIKVLDIKLDYSNLEIIKGKKFKVELNDKNFICSNSNGNVSIKQVRRFSLKNKDTSLRVYIPSDIKLNSINVENGVGKTKIEYINANRVHLDFDAGKTTIEDIISDNTSIDTGAGLFEIKNGTMKNVDFDSGVGKCDITAKINGTSKFDTGIGNLSLNLIGDSNNYKIIVNKGIGDVLIDNVSKADNSITGGGDNVVSINSGIGKVYVNYIKKVNDL